VPISPMDEYLAHQTTETFDRVFTSDRNFYDRYYFNLHPCSDELFLITGLGQYPNLGVTDAFVTVSHGAKQYTVRASRELGIDRLDTRVGPFRVEVLEGLRSLRVICEPNEWGITFDLVWRGSTPALEEPTTFIRWGSRVMTNVSRYAQVGTWEGSLEVAGATYAVSPDTWKGARDHSWGIRPVGEPEPRGIRAKARAAGTTGQWHNWIPMQFDDRMIKVMLDEESDGARIVAEAAQVWNEGSDREAEEFGVPEISIDYISGTREMQRAVVELTRDDGSRIRVVNTPLRTIYLNTGSGYRYDGEWGHGVYQGDLKIEGTVHHIGAPTERLDIAGLNETLCRFDLDTGEVGWGMHENMVIGAHHPSGFHSSRDLAP